MKIFDAKIRLIDEFTPTLNKVSQSLVEHEKTNKRTIKTISKTGETITGIGAKISLLSAPLAAAAAEGLKLSSSFQDGMAKVSTLVDTSVTDMTKLAQGVRKVSDETGMSVTELAEAEYQALSASVDAGHVTEFLEVAAKGARAGFTSTSTAIDGLTTVINSYKMSAADAGKVMDEFLMTQNLGKTTVDALAQGIYKIFAGKIFMQSRNSESYTMEFVAYDNLIYLSKSHINAKFTDITIRDCISQICQLVGVSVGDLSCDDLNQKVNFVADDMAGSEAISKALETATAWTGWTYHIYMSIDKSGKQVLNVVRANTVIDSLVLTDTKDIMTAAHSASLEDMVNRVAIADKDGNITGYLTMDDDAKKYGMIQGIYRVQDKQDTQTYAKKMLHGVTENSQLTALGNIQCISGYAVTIQEEQIQGKFLIIADSHNIAGNVHKMNLTLRYITEPEKKATYTGA